MNRVNTILLVAAAYLAVFGQAYFSGLRGLLNVQVDLLPILVVYAGFSGSLGAAGLLALLGGCGLDSLSLNPLGASVLPLLIIGALAAACREVVLRDQIVTQMLAGGLASLLAPGLTLLVLWWCAPGGEEVGSPGLSWETQPVLETGASMPVLVKSSFVLRLKWFYQTGVMAACGALLGPVIFTFFNWVDKTFNYAPAGPSSFRSDREIKRGRHL